MDPGLAKVLVLIANGVMLIIRALYAIPSLRVPVARRRQHAIQDVPLAIAKVSFYPPIIWAVSPLFAFADYPLHMIPLITGTFCYAFGLWLFHRSHADLGTNWSQTLEVKEDHQLVTDGIYSRIRHPMYLGCLIFAAGQGLVVPNYLAGPSFGIGMMLLFALRVGYEERMMFDEFGDEYTAYCKRSNRLIPGIW
jgi:protein-S-isoprenylcysteine O-methyltransferase Ste14